MRSNLWTAGPTRSDPVDPIIALRAARAETDDMNSPATGASAASPQASRMAKVIARTQRLRLLFEMEREFARTVSALIPRVGQLELKFLIAQHAWEAMDHARYLRERGRELAGFGGSDSVRAPVQQLFTEALYDPDPLICLAALYRVAKPAILDHYVGYQREADPLADWPTCKLIDEFVHDERRQANEMNVWIESSAAEPWCTHIRAALEITVGAESGSSAPENSFPWRSATAPYRHPAAPARAGIGQNNSVFGDSVNVHLVHDAAFRDGRTDPRVIRIMIYVWLMNELTAVEALATVHFDTVGLPFEAHLDLARHVWDEARHTQFGYRQLPRLGIPLSRLNIHDLPYRTYQRLTPAERYARLSCVAEPESFEIKAHIMDRVRELSDFEADTLLAFDRSDEQNHVRYGHRWVPQLMKLEGVTATPEQFVNHARERFDEEMARLRTQPDIAPTLRDPQQLTVAELQAMFAS